MGNSEAGFVAPVVSCSSVDGMPCVRSGSEERSGVVGGGSCRDGASGAMYSFGLEGPLGEEFGKGEGGVGHVRGWDGPDFCGLLDCDG